MILVHVESAFAESKVATLLMENVALLKVRLLCSNATVVMQLNFKPQEEKGEEGEASM